MSPEQLRGEPSTSAPTSGRSASSCYEMADGAASRSRRDVAPSIAAILTTSRRPRPALAPGCPTRLDAIVGTRARRNSRARDTSAEEMVRGPAGAAGGRRLDGAITPRAGGAATTVTSIAVLPFADMSPAKDQELPLRRHRRGDARRAAPIPRAAASRRAPPRSSSRASQVDVREIGEQLNVGTVLEGQRAARRRPRARSPRSWSASTDGYRLWYER